MCECDVQVPAILKCGCCPLWAPSHSLPPPTLMTVSPLKPPGASTSRRTRRQLPGHLVSGLEGVPASHGEPGGFLPYSRARGEWGDWGTEGQSCLRGTFGTSFHLILWTQLGKPPRRGAQS